jgi:hypothetical protein
MFPRMDQRNVVRLLVPFGTKTFSPLKTKTPKKL